MPTLPAALGIGELLAAYRQRVLTPAAVIDALYARIEQGDDYHVWIALVPREQALARAHALATHAPEALPLYGIPFAIKDNIDLAGVPTTAACPPFAYTPTDSAFVVSRLIEAGAIPIGKTNLDQFATGLVGTRSPYGACRNSFDRELISGGSSSGSAVAVALGLVSFALGSDTAGSGRVPAAFNNLVGFKPTRGRLSPRGMVPICRSLDAVSIFALTAEDAARVCRVCEGFDAEEPYSRHIASPPRSIGSLDALRVAVPRSDQLEFFGNAEYRRLYHAALAFLERNGARCVPIDFTPFREAAQLLYEGPWLAERYIAVEQALQHTPDALLPVTRAIIEAGTHASAVDAFRAQYRLQTLRQACESQLASVDFMITPTAGTIYSIAQVEADPVRLNSNLGVYTNFVNLLDLAAVSVPAGFTTSGVPFGMTLHGRAWNDYQLLSIAGKLQRQLAPQAGALRVPLPLDPTFDWTENDGTIAVAVCGAHLDGLPLNHQLRSLGAALMARTHTASCYRFYALPGGPPLRPGLVRVAHGGVAIEVEVWSVPRAAFGSFVAGVMSPLAIGNVELADGRTVCGFVCEGYGVADAQDISSFGGWRAYLNSRM